VIWRLLFDGATQTARGVLPDLIKFCATVRCVGPWRGLLAAIESVGWTEPIDIDFVYQVVFDLGRDPAWGDLAVDCIRYAASRAGKYETAYDHSVFDRRHDDFDIICLVQEHLDDLVHTLGTPGANVLLEPIIRLVLGEAIKPCPAFQGLGITHTCNVVLNLVTAAYVQHRAAYYSRCTPTVSTKESVNKRLTSIFHPKAKGVSTRKFYSSFPELQTNLDGFLKSLKVLVLGISAYTNELHKKGVARNAPERVALREEVMARLIGTVTDPNARVAPVQLWGQSGEKDIQVDQALLSRLIRYGAINPDAARELEQAVSVLALQTSPEVLGPKVAEMLKCWDRLKNCVKAPGFVELYDVCGDYEVAMLDPDDVTNLKVGHEVSSCLAPDGTHSGELFSRLAGGWILWAVKNPQGETAAIAWGALNRECELVIDFIDERVKFRVQPLGNNLVEQLIAFAPVVAKTVNAQAAWLAPARYGRLEKFPAFVDRTTEFRSFRSLVPNFLGEGTYTDALDQGEVPYVRLL